MGRNCPGREQGASKPGRQRQVSTAKAGRRTACVMLWAEHVTVTLTRRSFVRGSGRLEAHLDVSHKPSLALPAARIS